jgi:hypothetical protein
MQFDRTCSIVRTLLMTAFAIIAAAPSQAAILSFHVDVNTSSLVGNPNGPYSLDFQLNDGGGTATNVVSLSHFIFTNGAPTGSANLIGGATGNLTSGVTLTDALFFSNEFFQGFSVTTTHIGFDVSMTEAVEPGIPDAFSMAILDSGLFNIPTTGLGDSLLLVNIASSPLRFSDIQLFSSTAPDSGVTVAATPEPGTLGLVLGSGLIALVWSVRRKYPVNR